MEYETGIKIRKKEWDVFVFGDANIDLIIPNGSIYHVRDRKNLLIR